MSRLLRALLVCLSFVLLLPTPAAADQTDEADALVVEAKAVLDDVNARSAQLTEMWNTVAQIDPTGKRATDALPVLADLEATYDELEAGQESIAALFAELETLDVSDEYKEYAAQRQAVAALWIEFCDVERELITTLETVYDPGQMSKISQAEAEQLSREATELADREAEITSEVSAKEAAAVQYFLDNVAAEDTGGSESAAEEVAWGVIIAAGVFGLIVNAVFAFLCGFLARRKNRSALGWAILGFLIPIIALILVLVLKEKPSGVDATPDAPPAPEGAADPLAPAAEGTVVAPEAEGTVVAPEATEEAPEAPSEWQPPSASAAAEPVPEPAAPDPGATTTAELDASSAPAPDVSADPAPEPQT